MSRSRTLRAIILIVALLPATCGLASDEEARAARLLREALARPQFNFVWVQDEDPNWLGLFHDGEQYGAYSRRTKTFYFLDADEEWHAFDKIPENCPPPPLPVFRRAPAIISGGC